MASPPPPPPPPVGEDSWLDFIDQQRRTANSIEQRIHAVELYRSAVNAEPGSIRLWIAYCDYFWFLYVESAQRTGAVAYWPQDEQAAAADFFSLDAALHLWSEGHEATKYRLSDSHELWNRWIALERDLLDRTRTTVGVRRITHLYRNRLTIPHVTWDDTSSAFSSFLSEFNPAAYEETMRVVTEQSRVAKYIIERRDPMEMALRAAVRSGDESAHRDTMARYLGWEVANVQAADRNDKPTALRVALGLFNRALTGILRTDDAAWTDLIVFISQLRNGIGDGSAKNEELAHILPNSLDVLQRAVRHCPWSGALWARYIINGEQSSLSFSDMERIKHAATNSALDRDGMAAVVDMYATWCGYLRRCAMDPNASDESVDLADSGLVAALEAVQVWGERRFGSAFQGDPNFRLERIMIYHLTEKHGAIDEAREHWEKLARKELLARDYSFWLSYYMWEMNLLQSRKGTGRSPTPAPVARLSRTPSRPASILQRALQTPQLNWPERVIEIYVEHCNDFESSGVLQNALDEVHNLQRVISQQRKHAATMQAAQAEAHARAYENQILATAAAATESQALGQQQTGGSQEDLNAGVKRKWEPNASGDTLESATKKSKNEDHGAKTATQSHEQKVQAQVQAQAQAQAQEKVQVQVQVQEKEQQPPKRDRENTSVFVSNLPSDVTVTKVRQYFREYGHVNNIQLKQEENGQSTVALVEFRSVEDVQTALIRDGKYFGGHTISVKEAAGITLYVTNFPPSTDDHALHKLFGKSSNIFGIRWPSLKYNAHRRFCYVSFRDPESAAKATGLNGKLLEGKYRLSVQYSDPAAKKAREGATDEGREVHIKNIPQEFDEQAIEQLVAKYGTVKRVRLLHNMAGRSRGTAFVDLETKEEAERVVSELDKVKLGSQILQVELSVSAKFKPSARETSAVAESAAPLVNGAGSDGHDGSKGESASHEARGNLHLRSFALLGIPDTVNITRVRSLAEPHGYITKLKLYPEHGGAIIEFEDETTAGKAQLALEGTQLEGHPLRVGAVPQLFKEKSGVRIDRVDIAKPRPPKPTTDTSNSATATTTTTTKKTAATTGPVLLPAVVRRPVLGGKGAKHGLGISAISATTVPKKDDRAAAMNGAAVSGTDTGAAPPKKSNADFRALFLAGKSSMDSKGTDNQVESKPSMAASSVDNSETDVVVNGH